MKESGGGGGSKDSQNDKNVRVVHFMNYKEILFLAKMSYPFRLNTARAERKRFNSQNKQCQCKVCALLQNDYEHTSTHQKQANAHHSNSIFCLRGRERPTLHKAVAHLSDRKGTSRLTRVGRLI